MPSVVTLTMNPAVDLSTATERVEPLRKLRCGDARRDPGGGGINVARVVRRLGADVIAIFPAGGFAGRALAHLVEQEGVTCRAVPIRGETRQDFTVLDQTLGQQYRFVLPGPHVRAAEWRECLKVLEALDPWPDFICASGSLPPGVPDDFYARVARIVARRGGRLALDTSGEPLRQALRHPVHLIKPNLREMGELVGDLSDDPIALAADARRLIRDFPVDKVALSLGASGAVLVTADRAWRAAALPVEPVSTVGAGDSFLGAMVWALAAGKSDRQAFRYAAAGGSAAVLAEGTGLCQAGDVRRLLKQVVVHRLAAPARGAATP